MVRTQMEKFEENRIPRTTWKEDEQIKLENNKLFIIKGEMKEE